MTAMGATKEEAKISLRIAPGDPAYVFVEGIVKPINCGSDLTARRLVAACNSFDALTEANKKLIAALEFAKLEASVARGLLWTKADVFESVGNARSAADCRRSAEKLDEVVRQSEAAIKVTP